MNDSGLYRILRRLLDARTKKEADAFLDNVGDGYTPIAREVLGRINYHRTTNQNSMLHLWFAQIAKHKGDMTASQVKGECHRRWGLPIRLRNNRFAWIWGEATANLSYEQQCSVLESGIFQISSGMTTKELTEYMNEIETHYRAEGVRLTEPGIR